MAYEKDLKSGEKAKILYIKDFKWKMPVTDVRPAPPLIPGEVYQFINLPTHSFIFFDSPLQLDSCPVPVVGIRALQLKEDNLSWTIDAQELDGDLLVSEEFSDDNAKKAESLMKRNSSGLTYYLKHQKNELEFIISRDDYLNNVEIGSPAPTPPIAPPQPTQQFMINISDHFDQIREAENKPYNDFLMFFPYQAEPLLKFLTHMNDNQKGGPQGLDYPISMILEGIATKEDSGANVNIHVMLDALQDYMYALKTNTGPKEHLLHKLINYALLEIYRNNEEHN